MDFIFFWSGFASRVSEWDGWGYLFQFLASAHATKCANLKVPYLAVLRFAPCPVCAALPGVLGRWRTDNSNQNFPGVQASSIRSVIGHIWPQHRASHFFCESHRSYIEEGRWSCGPSGTHYIFIGHGESWFQDGSQKKKSQDKKKLSL